MAKLWMLLLVSILVLSPIRQGVLAQFGDNSNTTDDGCSTTPDCQSLNGLLSGCGGKWEPPPAGRTSGEYGVDRPELASCMCTEQYYNQLDQCLKCYQGQGKTIIPASRAVYDSDCDKWGYASFPGPEKKSSTKTILIAVLASAAVLIIAAAVFWFVYIKYKSRRRRENANGNTPDPNTVHRPSMVQPQEFENVKPTPSPQMTPQTPPTPQTSPYPAHFPQPQPYMPYQQAQHPQLQQPQHSMYIPSTTPIPTPGTEVIATPGTSEQSGVQEYYPPPSHPPPPSASVPAVYYASSMGVPDTSSGYPSPGGQPHDGGLFPSALQPGGRPLSDMNREPSPSST